MNTIKTYLDNVFAAFPQTEEVRALRREMLASMEEKYHALKEEGMSEHEAVGSVIANFGSIDEIAAELGLKTGQEQSKAEPQKGISLSRGEAEAYLARTKSSSIWIGLGVWLILTGVSSLIFLGDTRGVLALFLAIATAVSIFIVTGIRMGQYESYERQYIRLDTHTRAEMEQQSARFMPRFVVQIVAGILSIFFGVGSVVGFHQVIGNTEAPALMLFLIGFAVFLFVTASMPKSAFDILLGRGDYRNKAANNKIGRIIGTVAAVYWPIMVAIFLLWSFAGNAWHISWLIWPVAGVLFGAIAGGVSVWFSLKEE